MKAVLTLLLLLISGLAAGCRAAPILTPSPTLSPSPTPVPSATPAPPVQGTPSPGPFTLDTPVVVVEPSAAGPSPTPAPLPGRPPAEMVAILRPATGSHVVSPFRIVGRAGPSWNNQVRLRLIGEDGRTIATTITYLLANPGNAGLFSTTMDFSIPGLAEAARLEVINRDREDGETNHLASVHLTLLSEGNGLTYIAIRGAEQLAILSPAAGERIQGGIVRVEGIGWTQNQGPLIIEVHDSQGAVLGRAQTRVQSPGPGQMGPFKAAVPYSVAQRTRGRIVVYEPDNQIPGYVHYSSIRVILDP